MSIQSRLLEDMKKAMQEGQEEILSVLKKIRALLKTVEIEMCKELDEEEVVEILQKNFKKRRDDLSNLKELDADTVNSLQKELAVLKEYLPEKRAKIDLRSLVEETLGEIGEMEREAIFVTEAVLAKSQGLDLRREDVEKVVMSLLEK